MFVQPVVSMDQTSWTASHVETFAFFAGCPAGDHRLIRELPAGGQGLASTKSPLASTALTKWCSTGQGRLNVPCTVNVQSPVRQGPARTAHQPNDASLKDSGRMGA
jgi:hypothetical protein